MKKLQIYIILLATLLAVNSCSENDEVDVENPPEYEKLYKKSKRESDGNLVFEQEVFYNSDNKIDSITRDNIGFLKDIFKVTYRENNISNIDHFQNFTTDPLTDRIYKYDVIINSNSFVLESSGRRLEIFHTNGYINYTRASLPNTENVYEQFFIRNEVDQLISNSWRQGPGNEETYYYSNFDSGKKPGPLNSVIFIRYEDGIIYHILGLKLSKDNPLTLKLPMDDFYNMTLNYDEEGYVVQGFFNHFPSAVYYHEYLEP